MVDKLTKFVEERKLYNKGKHDEILKENAKNKLKLLLKKLMTTILVGSIASMEEKMGYIWGHGKYNDEKLDEELDLTALWKICRNDIFDKGNAKIRAMEKELDNYLVEVKRYTTQFKVEGNQ